MPFDLSANMCSHTARRIYICNSPLGFFEAAADFALRLWFMRPLAYTHSQPEKYIENISMAVRIYISYNGCLFPFLTIHLFWLLFWPSFKVFAVKGLHLRHAHCKFLKFNANFQTFLKFPAENWNPSCCKWQRRWLLCCTRKLIHFERRAIESW